MKALRLYSTNLQYFKHLLQNQVIKQKMCKNNMILCNLKALTSANSKFLMCSNICKTKKVKFVFKEN